MIDWLIILIVAIVIIILILSFEHFELSNGTSLNNLVDILGGNKDEEVKITKLTADDITSKNLSTNNEITASKINSTDINTTNINTSSLKTSVIETNPLKINNNEFDINFIRSLNLTGTKLNINNYGMQFVDVIIYVKDYEKGVDGLTITGLGLKYGKKLKFLFCTTRTIKDMTGWTKPSVMFDKNNILKIKLRYHNEHDYQDIQLKYIVGIMYSDRNVNTVYQYSSGYSKSNYLTRDDVGNSVLSDNNVLFEFTNAEIN